MELIEIEVWDKTTDLVENAILRIDAADEGFAEISLSSGHKKQSRGGGLFSSLTRIREELEQLNQFVLCNGSRCDVAPSGMSRQMGGGRRSYCLTQGKQALRSDLVDIFDPISKDAVSTVAEQKEYYQRWVKSLG